LEKSIKEKLKKEKKLKKKVRKEKPVKEKTMKKKSATKITVRKKLMIGFSLLNILIIVSGVFSLYNLSTLHTTIEELYNMELKGIEYIKDAQVCLISISENRNEMLLTAEQNQQSQYIENIQLMMDQFEVSLDNFNKTVMDHEEGKLRTAEIMELWSQLKPNENKIIDAARINNIDEGLSQAKANRLIVERIEKEIDSLVNMKIQLAEKAHEEAYFLYDSTKIVTIIIAALSVLIGIFATSVMSSLIAKPIGKMADAARKIADGDLSIEAVAVKNKDEIGDLANAFNTMIESLKSVIKSVLEASQKVASSSQQLSTTSEETTSAAEEVASTINQLAEGAGKQAEDASQASVMVNQITESIQHVAENANSAAMASTNITKEANNGLNEAKRAVEKIENIKKVTEESSESVKALGNESIKIGEIVEVIKGISDQTNLLALNAAIEAARAGEQGRGFAVVADEVRKLAEQSSSSAVQIADLIGNIQNETNKVINIMSVATNEVSDGVEAVNKAGNSFENIFNHINNITSQIQELSASVQQVAEGSRSMNESIENIASIAEETAAAGEEISAASEEQTAAMEEIANMAQELSKLAEELEINVSRFKIE